MRYSPDHELHAFLSQGQTHSRIVCERLTRCNDLREALAGGEEDEELAEVGEQAEVQKEQQKEIKE